MTRVRGTLIIFSYNSKRSEGGPLGIRNYDFFKAFNWIPLTLKLRWLIKCAPRMKGFFLMPLELLCICRKFWQWHVFGWFKYAHSILSFLLVFGSLGHKWWLKIVAGSILLYEDKMHCFLRNSSHCIHWRNDV